jgi:hypothetical protein
MSQGRQPPGSLNLVITEGGLATCAKVDGKAVRQTLRTNRSLAGWVFEGGS